MELATAYYASAAGGSPAGGTPQAVAPASGPQSQGFGFNLQGGLTADHLPVLAAFGLFAVALVLLHARG